MLSVQVPCAMYSSVMSAGVRALLCVFGFYLALANAATNLCALMTFLRSVPSFLMYTGPPDSLNLLTIAE